MSFSRVLFRFAKKGEARYLSHRDLMRAFERALRRAGLPVRMTQGFNPHPRLSILAALPLGVEADDEVLEVEFEPVVPAQDARARLAAQLPEGLPLRSAETLPEGVRTRVEAVAYEVELPEGCGLAPADVERFLAQEAILVRRGDGPKRDIRPLVRGLSLDGQRLRFELAVAEGAAPRAGDVVERLLDGGPTALAAVRLRRTRVQVSLASPRHPSGTAAAELRKGTGNAT